MDAAQKKAEREARWAAATEARPTGRSESSEEDQATYDLTANAAMYNEGLHQLDASSCNILKESSTFINEPAAPVIQERPASQVREAAVSHTVNLILPHNISQVSRSDMVMTSQNTDCAGMAFFSCWHPASEHQSVKFCITF